MNLDKNSAQAKLYRWFYGLEVENMPQSLCPYFWKLVLMYTIFIPVFILSIPTLKEKTSLLIKIGTGIFVYVCLFLLFLVGLVVVSIFGVTMNEGSTLFELRGFGVLVSFALIVAGIVKSISMLISYISNQKNKRYVYTANDGRKYILDENGATIYIETKPNLVVEFVKAKYKKYCPKITWK